MVGDFSQFSWFDPMKRKSDVLFIFPQFISMVENICSSKIKYIRSDGGGEFIGHAMKLIFNREIVHRISCLGTPEQSGVAECNYGYAVET